MRALQYRSNHVNTGVMQMYTHKQALRMYRAYGVRVPVALGTEARTLRAQTLRAMRSIPASTQGIANMQAYAGFVPLPAYMLPAGVTNAQLQLAAEVQAYTQGAYTAPRRFA
jgi:hypothetical protein